MRRLLLLTYTFPPDNMAAAARPGQLYRYLPENGYQPIVVASSRDVSLIEHQFVHCVPAPDVTAGISLASALARWFMRFGAPYNDRLPWVPHAATAGARLVRAHSVSAIYSTSPFLASHLAALWLKVRFDLPWIADFQDPVRDNPFRTRRWAYPYDALIEYSIFRYADRLVANTDTVAAAWRNRYPQWEKKISVLWNSFDHLEEIGPGPAPERPYRVLAHIGGLYGGRHPGSLLTTLERLRVDASAIRLRLVGPIDSKILADQRPLFDRMCQSGRLEFDNRMVPRQEALREAAQANYLLLLDLNERNASFQVPSKLLDYVRAGKPILAYTPKNSPVERILARSGIPHVTIAPGTPEAIGDQQIVEFLRSPPELCHASPWFEETFSAKTQAQTVAGLLNGLLA